MPVEIASNTGNSSATARSLVVVVNGSRQGATMIVASIASISVAFFIQGVVTASQRQTSALTQEITPRECTKSASDNSE